MKKLLVGTSMLVGLACGVAACTDEGDGGSTTSGSTSSSTTSTVTGAGGGPGGAGGMGGAGGAGGAGGGEAQTDPSNLQALIMGGQVELSWVKSSRPLSRVVRAENAMPLGPDDPAATVVYEGAADTASEPLRNLLPTTSTAQRTYHYAVYGCDAAGSCGGGPASDDVSPTVAQALEGGGYNVVWRHANATVCDDAFHLGTAAQTSSPDWWKSCDANCSTATARQLDAEGIAQAEQMGQALASRGFPFGRVLASEFCRCMTTAELLNLGPAIEPEPGITGFVYDEANRCAHTMMLAATEPAPGTNVAIVGHSAHPCGELDTLAMGEAVIYKPDGNGGVIFITRVTSSGWATLH